MTNGHDNENLKKKRKRKKTHFRAFPPVSRHAKFDALTLGNPVPGPLLVFGLAVPCWLAIGVDCAPIVYL